MTRFLVLYNGPPTPPEAGDRSEAIDLLRDHPLLSLGEWVIEVFEVPRR
jgi:hypothetical protein